MQHTHPAVRTAASDHRVRVAEERRLRMRERLIEATLLAYARCEHGAHPVIDDVIGIAEVSRGSFYKHFDAIDEVFAEIGRRMAAQMLSSYSHVVSPLEDGAARLVLGPLMALVRASMEPHHGAFIARVDFIEFLASTHPRANRVALSLEDGRRRGALRFARLDAAADFVIGTTLQGARRVVRTGVFDIGYLRELCTMLLLGLGAGDAQAQAAFESAWQRLQDAQGELAWWKQEAVAAADNATGQVRTN